MVKVLEAVAFYTTGRACHSALQLPSKQVINDAAAPASGIVPGLLSLGTDGALPF